MASVSEVAQNLRLSESEIANLDLSALPGELPDIAALSASGRISSEELEVIWAGEAARLWELATQQISAVIGFRLGVTLPKQIQAIRTIVRAQLTDAIRAISEHLLEQALEAGIKAAAEVVSAAPLIGALVKVLWSVGKLTGEGLRNADNYGVFDPEGNPVAPRALDAAADRYLYDTYVLGRTRSGRDWTGIWLPPGMARVTQRAGEGKREPFGAVFLKSNTWRVETLDQEPGWLGGLPGTDWLHESFEGTRDTGAFVPTVRSEATTLWGIVAQNGPTQYTVHGPNLVRYWQEYLLALRTWLEQARGSNRPPDRIIDAIIHAYSDEGPLAWHFWRIDEHKPDAGPEGAGGPWGIQHASCVKQARWLAQAQRANLSTATCAYVDDSFAAIRGDAVLKAVWDQKRRELLQHPSRIAIDVENIPDAAYAQAMREAQASGPPSGGWPDVTVNLPGADTAPAPTYEVPEVDRGTGLAALVLLGGLGAGIAGWLGLRRRR